jgi:hypothetical protein
VYNEVSPLSFISPIGEAGSGYKYLFSADINPQFFVSGGVRNRLNIAISPKVKIRMFNDSSFAVRTPSFEPGLRFFYRLSNQIENYKYIEIGAYHHSNGQDGPSIENGRWNTYNGNFSTNYIIAAYNWGKYMDSNMMHYGAAIQKHFGIKGALEQDDNLKGNYGQWRLNLNFLRRIITRISYPDPQNTGYEVFALFKEKIRMQASLSYILAGLDNISFFKARRRLNTEISFHYSFKTWSKMTVFGTLGYYGEDPYNIYFSRSYGFFRFGISTGGMYFRADPDYAEKPKPGK